MTSLRGVGTGPFLLKYISLKLSQSTRCFYGCCAPLVHFSSTFFIYICTGAVVVRVSQIMVGQGSSVQGGSNQRSFNPGSDLYTAPSFFCSHRCLCRTRERVIPPSTSSGSSSLDEDEVEEERAVSSRGRVRRPNPRLFD